MSDFLQRTLDRLRKIKKNKTHDVVDIHNIIEKSGLFDINFYRSYPDLQKLPEDYDFISHYINYGVFEGRDPNDWFSSSYYLESHKDVFEAGLNPFSHYINNGLEEKRATSPNDPRNESRILKYGQASSVEFDEDYYVTTDSSM